MRSIAQISMYAVAVGEILFHTCADVEFGASTVMWFVSSFVDAAKRQYATNLRSSMYRCSTRPQIQRFSGEISTMFMCSRHLECSWPLQSEFDIRLLADTCSCSRCLAFSINHPTQGSGTELV